MQEAKKKPKTKNLRCYRRPGSWRISLPARGSPRLCRCGCCGFCRLLPGLCRVVVGFSLFFDRRFGTIYNKGEPCVRSPLFKGRETARRTHPESQIPLEHLCRNFRMGVATRTGGGKQRLQFQSRLAGNTSGVFLQTSLLHPSPTGV